MTVQKGDKRQYQKLLELMRWNMARCTVIGLQPLFPQEGIV